MKQLINWYEFFEFIPIVFYFFIIDIYFKKFKAYD